MATRRSENLVGREREMAELEAALDHALAGRGQVVMLVGEPGIGKTRIAAELSDIARGRGAEVLWGRCSEEAGTPAFWPWMQVIRSYLRGHDTNELRSRFGTRAADLAQIEPEVRALLPETGPAPPMDDPDSARFRLFDSVAAVLRPLTESGPVILILDDLQWADAASVKLFEFVASEIPESRLLIIGTYRDVEMSRRHPLPATLDKLSRYQNFRKLHLRGLSEDAVAQMVSATAGTLPAKAVVEVIYGQTEGNPLFVREMARLLTDEGLIAGSQTDAVGIQDFALPAGIKEAIGRRLNSLSQPCNALLSVASVAERHFNLSLLSRLVVVEERPRSSDVTDGSDASARRLGFQTPGGHPAVRGHQSKLSQPSFVPTVIQDALDEAEAARLIEKASPDDDAYVFTHSVIQRTLEEELSTKARAQLHARVALVLEEEYGAAVEEHAAELAHHFAEARGVLGPAKFVAYSVVAGENGLAHHAYEDALSHFTRASASGDSEARDQHVAGIVSGIARAQSALGIPGWQDALWRAFQVYRDQGRVSDALAVAGAPEIAGLAPGEQIDQMLKAGLDLAPPSSVYAARLLSRIALRAGHLQADYSTSTTAFDRAVEIARREGDHFLAMWTLERAAGVARVHLQWDQSERFARQALRLAALAKNPQAECMAHRSIGLAALRRGDRAGAERSADAALETARKARQMSRIRSAALLAQLLARSTGSWDRAANLVDQLSSDPPWPSGTATRAAIEAESGDVERAVALAQGALEAIVVAPEEATFGAAHSALEIAVLAHEASRSHVLDGAARIAEEVLSSSFSTPYAVERSQAILGLAAAMRADETETRRIYSELGRLRSTFVPPIAGDRLLGLLAGACGMDVATASGHFNDAITFCRQAGYQVELARSIRDYADSAVREGGYDDWTSLAALVEDGISVADSLRMAHVARRLAELRDLVAERQAKRKYPDRLTGREVEVLRLVAAGRSNREIADALFISENTVIRHVSNIFAKIGAANRVEAVAYAIRNRLVEDSANRGEPFGS